MTAKKPKKKVIDGVVKKSRKSPAPSARGAQSDQAGTTIPVSVKNTKVTVIEATDINEPAIDRVVETDGTVENRTAVEIRDAITGHNNSTTAEPPLDDDAETITTADISPLDSVSDAILEEEVIDENLDAIIAEQEKEAMPKKKKAKPVHKSAHQPIQVTARPFRILSRLLTLVTIAAVTALTVRIATTGIVPNKYLIPAIAIIAVILLFCLFKAFRNKTRVPVLIILNLITLALAGASIFGFLKIDETMSFLNRNFNDGKEYSIYNVIVNKKSNYNSLDDVKSKTFHSISDFVDTQKLESAVKEQASATVAYADGITSLLKNALDDNSYIVILNSGTYSSATDGDNDQSKTYADNLKIIAEIKVESEKQSNDASSSDLAKDSFVLYVSGIDTRSGLMLDRSLSDVNIVITVNPKTKNILMSTIPRDYYVQLHGTTGLPDKLTHAGSLGGVQLSMATIGDLLGVNFDRYIRVNFNFVINLVDAIGGITVYSDVDYTFTSLHPENKKCTFHPGNNAVDGACALGFARERYAYSDGDRHRGRNQEQVIEKIFEKVTSSSTLVSKYSSILDALSGSFDTNISTNDITSLANMQLSDMAKWTVDAYNLDGTGGNAFTYSYPSQYLYVMYPDQTTVDTAKQKIQAVLTGAV